MTPTPRTDAMRLKMTQLGWPSDGEPVAMLMASHAEIERELSSRTNPHRGSDFKAFLDQERLIATPRTDALVPTQGQNQTIYQYILVLEEHARQLERELADKSESLDFQTQLNREIIDREKQAHAELAAERALADRLATWAQEHRNAYMGQVPHQDCGCGDCQTLPVLDADLTAWKESRNETP